MLLCLSYLLDVILGELQTPTFNLLFVFSHYLQKMAQARWVLDWRTFKRFSKPPKFWSKISENSARPLLANQVTNFETTSQLSTRRSSYNYLLFIIIILLVQSLVSQNSEKLSCHFKYICLVFKYLYLSAQGSFKNDITQLVGVVGWQFSDIKNSG